MKMMSDIEPLPKSWVLSKIDELSDIVRGITFPASAKENQKTSSNICCLRTSNVQKNLNWQDIYFVDKKFVKREEQELRKDDILMSMANSYELVGKVCTANELPQEATFGAFLTALRPADSIDPRYFYYFLNSSAVQKKLRGNSSQTTNIANISVKSLKAIEIVIAPLNEQRRIADKLDTTLSAVEACKQKLNNAAKTIQRFRQSVLAAAVSGELTREWREERGIEKEWEEGTIGDLIIGKPRNGYSPKACDYQTECKSLTLTATTSGVFNPDCYKFIDEDIGHDSHLWLEDGDVLIQRANTLEYVGVSAIYKGGKHEFIYPDLMMKCKANDRTTTEFLHILFSSHPVRSFFKANATGTSGNMPKINQKIVMAAPVKWPSTEEQIEITKKVYELRGSEKDALAQIKTAEKTLEMLKRSLLNTAFRGELVPQDPNDEPASVLLERIKAQREAEAANKKPAKRGRKKKADAAQLAIPDGIADNHLAKVLEECGALSELALLAASELELEVFHLQLSKELNAGGLKQFDIGGEAAYADAAWEEEG